ncbi:hypothetical protein [Parasitella parasitica]|uniref:UBX domain-containing protein 2 n=1 Tax=Parasitella parasitica TaxID=35722 RepID=A0A0B7NC97_9FUNG|nr:hypothetical protein [Parasitella parasitica]
MDDIWFKGSMKDAISLVAEKQCVFLVYIHDNSEKTNIFNDTLKNNQVTKAINEGTVAVAMEKSSENAVMFGQYYPIQTVPILYFIKQGTIRDFGVETLTSQEIIDKINAVNQISTVPAPQSLPVSTTVAATEAAPATPAPAAEPSTENTNVTPTTSSTHSADSSKNVQQHDERKEEMQKRLERVRKERAEREQQEAKERETKRRQDAKMLQDAQQLRIDKENKVYYEKIRKERQEDEAHRKRVREQIARDRAEKIAQRNAEKQRQSSESPIITQQAATAAAENSSSSSLKSKSHMYSNLNIRQLDGSNIRHQFEAICTLSQVRDWIKENRTESAKKPYKLSSQFPTRLFTDTDNDTTLKDLNLCPSATIIMKPLGAGSSSSSIRSISSGNRTGLTRHVVSAFDLVYGFIVTLINLLTGALATLFPSNGMAHTDVSASQQQQPLIRNMRGGQRLGGENITAESSSFTSSSSVAQRRNPYATRINTLHDEEDSEDDDKRPTYNGNSVNHE